MSAGELADVDPVVMNLVVARGIPMLASLDVQRYVDIADEWANNLASRLPALEKQFYQSPEHWRNDVAFFRLGLVCWYLDVIQGVAYWEDQRNLSSGMTYTDPSHLFLHGVMDDRRGTCANMSLLNMVIGRRLGLDVSLACLDTHFLCRYERGAVVHNIETTSAGKGGFSSSSDAELLAEFNLPRKAQDCGSDPRALTPHQLLGVFIGLRARHLDDTHRYAEANRDYLLARYLFPNNRYLYISQDQVSVQQSIELFEPGEKGHPIEVCASMRLLVELAPWERRQSATCTSAHQSENLNGSCIDAVFAQVHPGDQWL